MNFDQSLMAGNGTHDPALRALPSGQSVCSYTVATHRAWTDKEGQKQEQADCRNVVNFGKQADFITPSVRKGTRRMVRGRLQTRHGADAKNLKFKH